MYNNITVKPHQVNKPNPIFKFGKQFTALGGGEIPILEEKNLWNSRFSLIWINPEEKVYFIFQQLRNTFSTGAKRWLFVITHASFWLIWKSL